MTQRQQIIDAVTEEWQAVLDVEEHDPEDDFFTLGGNSLMAVALVERLEQRLGIKFPLETLFVEGTLPAVSEACVVSAEQATVG